MNWSHEEKEWMKARGLAEGQLERMQLETSDLKSFVEPREVEGILGKSFKPAQIRKPGLKKELKTADEPRREQIKESLVTTWVGSNEKETAVTHGVEVTDKGGVTQYLKDQGKTGTDRVVNYFRRAGEELFDFVGGSPILKAGRFEAVAWTEPQPKDRAYPHGPLAKAPATAYGMKTPKQYRKLSLDFLYKGVTDEIEEPVWAMDPESDPWNLLMEEHDARIAQIRRSFWLDAVESLKATMSPSAWECIEGLGLGLNASEVAELTDRSPSAIRKQLQRFRQSHTAMSHFA